MALKYAEITEKIIGCSMKVHSKMGSGYPEIIYSRCLAIEFDRINLSYKKEHELNVYYDDLVVGKRRVDFIVEGKIVVELKTLRDLTNADLAQTLNYLESHRQEIALLLNFGTKSLQFKRIINTKTNTGPAVGFPASDFSNPDNPKKNPDNPWL